MTYPARHVLSVGVVLALATGAWSIGNSGTSQQAQQVEAVAPSLEQMNAPSPSMAFEPNHGQTGPHVDYVSRGEGYGLLLSPTEAVFSLRPAAAAPAPGEGRARNERPAPTVLRMSLVDGNPAAPHVAAERLPGASHYLTGSDPANWRRNVPRYGRVEYKSVYDGIDLVYYGNQGQLEYDFVVAPGKDPGRIALEFSGISSLDLDEAGPGSQSKGGSSAGLACKNECNGCPHGGVARKRQFGLGCENAQGRRAGPLVQHENRFAQVQFSCDFLHGRIVQSVRIRENGQGIAAKWCVCEHIQRHKGVIAHRLQPLQAGKSTE